MEKKCSIRLLLLGIIVSAAFSLSAGFFAGTQKNWRSYEERIVLLQQQNANGKQQVAQPVGHQVVARQHQVKGGKQGACKQQAEGFFHGQGPFPALYCF